MISVRDGQNLVLAQITNPVPPEIVALPAALGRVLAEDVRAPFDVPPTDNSAVDGYAVTSADIPALGTRELIVAGELGAGAVLSGSVPAGHAVRIMTGAPLPTGADTVYPQEIVERRDDRLVVGPLEKGVNVRSRGEDVEAGSIVLEAGTVIGPPALGLASSLGACQILVHRRPRVALLSTGDEVVEPGQPRRPGQIYDANRFALRGAIEQSGGQVVDLGIVPDVQAELRERLEEAARVGDLVVTSGGVSVGVYDFVKETLGEIGAVDFWQVRMQPGRPLAFGRVGETLFFGLPGNPVASMLAYLLFVRPALFRLAGRRHVFPDTWHASAVEPMRKKRGRAEFKRGVLRFAGSGWEVRITGPQGSGILSSLAVGNCLIHLEEDRGDVAPGETVIVEPFSGGPPFVAP
jgi:molybdopterin molybdotransferase